MNLDLLIFGKFHLWSQYLRIFGRNLQLKTITLLVFFLCVNRFFEKLVNNMLVDHFEKFGFLLISSMVPGLLIKAHLLAVISDRIVRTFNRSMVTQDLALDISKNPGRVWHTGIF